MLVIRAQNKSTGEIHEFTPTDWYIENNSGNYTYLSTVHKSGVSAPKAKTTAKRGCGCANKKK